MQIEDLKPAATSIDDTPRPKASQVVAAAKRARQDEPTPIALARMNPVRRYVPFGVGALVLIVAILATQQQISRTPLAITPVATEAPARAFVASPQASPEARTASPEPNPSVAMVSAYAAPDGLLLGQIELTRQITPVAHYGSDWIQADVVGSGKVWLRRSDVPDLALIGPDLTPPTPQLQTGRGLTVWTPPAPATTPVPPVAPIVVNAPLRIRAEDDCSAEHGRCDPPCTAEHGRCSVGDK